MSGAYRDYMDAEIAYAIKKIYREMNVSAIPVNKIQSHKPHDMKTAQFSTGIAALIEKKILELRNSEYALSEPPAEKK